MSGRLGSLGAGISGLPSGGFLAQLMFAQWEEDADEPLVPDAISAPHEAFKRGREFYAKRQFKDAVVAFGEAVRLKPDFLKAQNNLGCAHFLAGNLDTALGVFELVISLDPEYARALYNKALTLGALGRDEEAIALYDDVVTRFGTAPELFLRELVAASLCVKALTLGALGRNEKAIALYGDLFPRTAPEQAVREIALYDDVVARFGTAPELVLRELVAASLHNKALIVAGLVRHEEAIAIYDDVIARFGTAPEPTMRELVGYALATKGLILANKLRRFREAVAVLRKARKFHVDAKKRRDVAIFIEVCLMELKEQGSDFAEETNYNTAVSGEVTITARRRELPRLPKGLDWPQEHFDQSPEYGRRGGITEHLKRVWVKQISFISMPAMREHYPSTAKAINNHRVKIPKELLPAKLAEVNDRALESGVVPVEDAHRLGEAWRRRQAKRSVAPAPT